MLYNIVKTTRLMLKLKFYRLLWLLILRKNLKNFIRLARLFFQTVHSVNAKDYTKEQLDVYPYDSEFTKRLMIVVAK